MSQYKTEGLIGKNVRFQGYFSNLKNLFSIFVSMKFPIEFSFSLYFYPLEHYFGALSYVPIQKENCPGGTQIRIKFEEILWLDEFSKLLLKRMDFTLKYYSKYV